MGIIVVKKITAVPFNAQTSAVNERAGNRAFRSVSGAIIVSFIHGKL